MTVIDQVEHKLRNMHLPVCGSWAAVPLLLVNNAWWTRVNIAAGHWPAGQLVVLLPESYNFRST